MSFFGLFNSKPKQVIDITTDLMAEAKLRLERYLVLDAIIYERKHTPEQKEEYMKLRPLVSKDFADDLTTDQMWKDMYSSIGYKSTVRYKTLTRNRKTAITYDDRIKQIVKDEDYYYASTMLSKYLSDIEFGLYKDEFYIINITDSEKAKFFIRVYDVLCKNSPDHADRFITYKDTIDTLRRKFPNKSK